VLWPCLDVLVAITRLTPLPPILDGTPLVAYVFAILGVKFRAVLEKELKVMLHTECLTPTA